MAMGFLKDYIFPNRGATDDQANVPTGSPQQDGVDTWPAQTGNASDAHSAPDFSARGNSIYPEGDFRNATPEVISDIKCEVMVNWLHSKQEERLWTTGEPGEGVVLKKSKGRYVCCPGELQYDGSALYRSIAALNVRCAMTINTRVISMILARNTRAYVELTPGLRLQVIPDIASLPNCQRHQSAAFIATQPLLVVWEDDPKRLMERATFIQDNLMKMIWSADDAYMENSDAHNENLTEKTLNESEAVEVSREEEPRAVVLFQALTCAATLILALGAMGGGWRNVAIEIFVDKSFMRVVFTLCIIPQLWLALFFFQALVGNITQVFGPIGQMNRNTKYYSGISPRRIRRDRDGGLPHVTIQMPVYKEGLRSVIEPTIRSVKAAISTYELQGGTANIFVNDDGMQLISPEEALERQDFYDENNIGWVARPKHNLAPAAGEVLHNRRGKFKKASNMNYALGTSIAVETKLAEIERPLNWNQQDENKAYAEALREVLDERNGETWADGNIRVGDYILLIDSDTRVPIDCFLEAVSEMEASPEVAIIQYASGVMNVTDSFFEKGITFFTNLIYTQIRYSVANGDVAPFVGHNAIMRWSAMQDIAFTCKHDNIDKYWSEDTVSEDFDMALRLQTSGSVVRLGAYKNNEYKEGVSLTVYDELARWEKYAYGCNELIFHPVHRWPTRGPFTKLFRTFLGSSMPLPSKFTIMAYVGTYYALGSAWLLTMSNYFLIGWFNGMLDHYYIDSFKVYFAIVVVFTAFGNVALALLRYRIGEATLVGALAENFKWVPLLVVFLGGVSLHVSQALLCHMFNIPMIWGATAKEAEHVTFFEEIPRVLRRFKWSFLFCIVTAVGVIIMATMVPYVWRIDFFTPIWPVATILFCHFALPIVLNPNLMLFTW